MNEIVTDSSHAQCASCRILKTVRAENTLDVKASTRREPVKIHGLVRNILGA